MKKLVVVLLLFSCGFSWAASPTELRDQKFQKVEGENKWDILIPPDFESLNRIYARFDCNSALEFLLIVDYEFERLGEQPFGPIAPIERTIENCTPGRQREVNLTSLLHQGLRDFDTMQIELQYFFVTPRFVVFEYNAHTTPGEKGDRGESVIGPQGIPGESIVGPQGPTGKDGKTVVGPPGKDGVCSCDHEDHKKGKGKKHLSLMPISSPRQR